MDVQTGFFYLFSLVLLFAAFRVVTARNPVHAVLFLMLAFSQASGIWLLLKAEFLAIVLVLVYLGAVMVLFLFVVMMLDINIDSLRQGFWKHFPVALAVGALISLEMAVVLIGGFRSSQARHALRRKAMCSLKLRQPLHMARCNSSWTRSARPSLRSCASDIRRVASLQLSMAHPRRTSPAQGSRARRPAPGAG